MVERVEGRAAGGRAPVSVTVCTLDEERDLPRMLASVAWADEVLVLDCGSTDGTVEVARAWGARVEHHPWAGFSASKNEAARRASHDWVLSLDADEVVDDELAEGLQRVLAGPPRPGDGFVLDRRGDFLGALLPNGARAAKRRTFVRLYDRRSGGWDESMPVHEVVRVSGALHRVPGALLHLNGFTVDEFVVLFNRYATAEAADLHARGRRASAADVALRPAARFAWLYLARGEWRLGVRGLLHAGTKAMSEFLRYAKLYELDHRAEGAGSSPRGPAPMHRACEG